jgi:hypothetical protein
MDAPARRRRPRPALSYANVVATLALLLALGGTSYAAVQLTTRNVKDRSLRGVDVRRNSLTGAEIAESTLGPVPRAVTADVSATARKADTAISASTAASATSATTATTADLADDATALGGLAASKFPSADVGTAPSTASAAAIISWSDLGASVRTVPSATSGLLTLANTGSANLFVEHAGESPSDQAEVVPSSGASSLTTQEGPFLVWSDAPGTRTWWVSCSFATTVHAYRCVGLRLGTAG